MTIIYMSILMYNFIYEPPYPTSRAPAGLRDWAAASPSWTYSIV